MGRRSIRAYCPRCRHQQPFLRSRFDWKLHSAMTLLTCGLWSVAALSAMIKRLVWPWSCEHCGWHEPDFRSPDERDKKNPATEPAIVMGQREWGERGILKAPVEPVARDRAA